MGHYSNVLCKVREFRGREYTFKVSCSGMLDGSSSRFSRVLHPCRTQNPRTSVAEEGIVSNNVPQLEANRVERSQSLNQVNIGSQNRSIRCGCTALFKCSNHHKVSSSTDTTYLFTLVLKIMLLDKTNKSTKPSLLVIHPTRTPSLYN